MALFKRNKTWWTDFSVNGRRYRQSLHTQNYDDAKETQRELRRQAEDGLLAARVKGFARLPFSAAADRYVESRSLDLSQSSLSKERQLLTKLRKFFGSEKIGEISGDQILAFREWRARDRVSPATINMEVGIVRRILKRAKRWHLVAIDLKPLKERHNIGRAMALDEKLRLLRLAGKNPDWQNVRLAAILALNTTMRGCEIKHLRWRDIDFMGKALTIHKSKTDAGERVIPLNSVAYNAVIELLDRARKVGAAEPQHFLFTSCENGIITPDRPQKSWRSSWRKLTKAIECPACGKLQDPTTECRDETCKADLSGIASPTAGLRFHDLRHHAITELAESQASDQTIMAIAGHVSHRMLTHYSHVRLEAKRSALDALSQVAPSTEQAKSFVLPGQRQGHDTKSVTNTNMRHEILAGQSGVPTELLENNGRPEWTRTIDLFRVKEAL